MSSRLVTFGFAAALLLIAGAPAFADGNDSAGVFDSSQENITTGDRNNSVNQNSQDAAIDGRGNSGTSMRSRQNNDTVGNDSNSVNVGQQKYRRNSRP
jgi:hypothetical protein